MKPAFAIAWAFVLWGTLLTGLALVRAVSDGVPETWAALGRLSLGNRACMVAAVLAWFALAAAAVARRLEPPEE